VPGVGALLAAAVAGIGGAKRPGQAAMAEAVHRAIETGEHLAVQAGTGTGKSLAYLVPAARHAITRGKTVVVATATIALQQQLVDRDLPRLAGALQPMLGRAPVFAILKGRRNYLCLYRLHNGGADDPQGTLFGSGSGSEAGIKAGDVSDPGQQMQRMHEWAEATSTGDRDELVPGVTGQTWRQVSVSAQECIGAQRCPFGSRCFAERAREAAGRAQIVVTNHALLAIDALQDVEVLPGHDVVIVDEAHDLVDRVTAAATGELSGPATDVAVRRCGRLVGADMAERLRQAGAALAFTLGDAPDGRIDDLPEALAATVAAARDAAGGCAEAVRASGHGAEDDPDQASARRAALASLHELQGTAARILGAFGADIAARDEVVWLDRPLSEDPRRPPTLRVAPLEVGGLLRERLFGNRTVLLTSATLMIGGSFGPLAREWGLPPDGAGQEDGAAGGDSLASPDASPDGSPDADPARLAWRGIDVGSPFDHPRSGILYVARHLPPPGRDGLPGAYIAELGELITAAGGRTLGLFSSMRAAREAAAELRGTIGLPLLCQGDDVTSALVRQFAEDEATCLFGTLSLWQGVDVPGRSLQLVVIDRIPFPRPDDPLASARQRAVEAHGGNGFMTVAAARAALLIAQGTGRLLRTMSDRGVVAVMDPRLVTARYGGFLRASLPPFWTTTDPAVVRSALRRLTASG